MVVQSIRAQRKPGFARDISRLLLIVASAVAFILAAAIPAAATGTTWDAGVVARGNDDCVTASSYYAQDANGVDRSTARVMNTWDCVHSSAKPPGHLAAKAAKWVYRPELASWAVCGESPWGFNETHTDWHQISLWSGYRDCGSDKWYGTMSSSYAWCECEGWLGGGMWSGMLYAAPPAATQGGKLLPSRARVAPPKPPWVRADNTVDTSKIPLKVPVIGPDGRQKRGKDGRLSYLDRSVLTRPTGKPAGV